MLTIGLYYCHTENNRMDKTKYMDLIANLSGNFRESVSIISPVITIELTEQIIEHLLEQKLVVVDDDNVDVKTNSYDNIIIKTKRKILSANYIYIPEFSRYYFVDDIISVSSTLWQIECSVDVLMSFKDQLMELDVFCERNEFNYDNMLIDKYLPSENLKTIDFVDAEHIYGSFYNMIKDVNLTDNVDLPIIISTVGYQRNITFGDFVSKVVSPLINYYILNRRSFSKLAEEFFNVSLDLNKLVEPSECVRFIKVFPFFLMDVYSKWNTKVYEPTDLPDTSWLRVRVGTQNVNVATMDTRDDIITIRNFRNIVIYGGRINIPNKYNNFLDYEPYTTVEIYIPFIGYVELPTDLVMGKQIDLAYDINIETGVANAILMNDFDVTIGNDNENEEVYNYKNYNIIYIGSCVVCYDMPIVRTNSAQQSRNLTMGMLKLTGDLIKQPLNAVGAFADFKAGLAQNYSSFANSNKTPSDTANFKTKRDSLSTGFKNNAFEKGVNFITENTIDFYNGLKSIISTGKSGNDLVIETSSYTRMVAKIYRPTPTQAYLNNVSKYCHLLGKPSKYIGKLSNLYGFTKLSGFHLEGLYNSTTTERNSIDESLRAGILMPEPENE